MYQVMSIYWEYCRREERNKKGSQRNPLSTGGEELSSIIQVSKISFSRRYRLIEARRISRGNGILDTGRILGSDGHKVFSDKIKGF
jgi:hypothetical protein